MASYLFIGGSKHNQVVLVDQVDYDQPPPKYWMVEKYEPLAVRTHPSEKPVQAIPIELETYFFHEFVSKELSSKVVYVFEEISTKQALRFINTGKL